MGRIKYDLRQFYLFSVQVFNFAPLFIIAPVDGTCFCAYISGNVIAERTEMPGAVPRISSMTMHATLRSGLKLDLQLC